MKYVMLLLNLWAVHSWSAYSRAVSGTFNFTRWPTYAVALTVGFSAVWTMQKAFMSEDEAGFEAWKMNSSEYIYDVDSGRVKNPQDVDPEQLKLRYLLASVIIWLVQLLFIYKAFRF